MVLRKRALQESEEKCKRAKVIAVKRAEEDSEDEEGKEEKKREQSQQDERNRLAKVKALEQHTANVKWAAQEAKRQKQHKTNMQWLQTAFPAVLANRCINAPPSKLLEDTVQACLDGNDFARPHWIADLWEIDKLLTPEWAKWKCMIENKCRSIRCGHAFQQIVAREVAPSQFNKNPADVILTLLKKAYLRQH